MLSDKIQVSYQASLATGSKFTVSLRMPNNLGFVEDVKLLLNRYGEPTGGEAELTMSYDKDNSDDECSVFSATTVFYEVGYRTFCFKLNLDSQEEIITFNPDKEEGILSDNGYYWEMFVYEANFKTPDEPKGGIMYQIYVDTFASKDLPEDEKARTVPWDAPIAWEPDSEGEYHNVQYRGGNLQGIIDNIDYLVALNVSMLYITPIFQSSSTHRYDTDNYDEIDSMIGNWTLLKVLHDKLNSVGILLVLDLVLNHSGINNKLLINEPEMYYWIEKYSEPQGWEGFKTLPEFNKRSPDYFKLSKRVLEKCSKYVDGVRFDVADHMPDYVLAYFRTCFAKYILGEVWDNAVDKGRGFLSGNELDGVMNYRFGNAILWYIVAGKSEIFKYIVKKGYDLYPKQALAVSPIFMSSHDTPRLLTSLVGEFMKKDDVTRENCNVLNFWDVDKNTYWWEDGRFNTYKFRKWEAEHDSIPPEKVELAHKLQKLAVFLQYTLPGIPAIFAGDEVGEWGYKDPFNRKPFPWDNICQEKLEFYKAIGKFRMKYKEVFSVVDNFELLEIDETHIVYRRGDMYFILNRTEYELTVDVNFSKVIFSIELDTNGKLPPYGAVALYDQK